MEKQLCLLIVGAIAVIYGIYRIYRYVKERKVLNKCFAFGKKTQGEFPLYFNYKGRTCGYDSYGDPILKLVYVDETGKEAKFLTDVNKETHSAHLTKDSNVPSLAYRVGVYSISLKEEPYGATIYPPIAEISMVPLSGCCDKWTVASTDTLIKDQAGNKVHRVILEHPVMGNLVLRPADFALNDDVKKAGGLKVGQSVILEQKTNQISSDLWRLTYRMVKMAK